MKKVQIPFSKVSASAYASVNSSRPHICVGSPVISHDTDHWHLSAQPRHASVTGSRTAAREDSVRTEHSAAMRHLSSVKFQAEVQSNPSHKTGEFDNN